MSQSKRGSFIEACVNTLIGYTVTFVFSPLIYWLAGVQMSAKTMHSVVLMFTVLSVIRGYMIRRFFNARIKQRINKLTAQTP